ncbi:MAG: exosortase/archaeosortase family protein [Gemmatimonadota bacterium]
MAYVVLFGEPLRGLVNDWWNDPEAGHGLLLAPLAVWLVWRTGLRKEPARPQPLLGAALLVSSVALRYVAGLAAEVFTMRAAAFGALLGLIVWIWGFRQVLSWWLPLILLALAIPLPSLITTALAFPLQLKASAMGAALLELRNVPVRLNGNIIQLPGQSLFVTEACSGLRSLTALISLGVLIGGLWLRQPWSRILLVLLAIPVAILINAVRVFLTGFLVFFVSQKMGEGFMHVTEGWLMFLVAFGMLGLIAFALDAAEKRLARRSAAHA